MYVPIQIPDDEYTIIDTRYPHVSDNNQTFSHHPHRTIDIELKEGYEKRNTRLYTSDIKSLISTDNEWTYTIVEDVSTVPIIASYMKGSFPHKYNYDYVLRSFFAKHNTHIFVHSPDKNTYIGYFMLLSLPEYPVVWLESVAGLSDIPQQYEGKGKLAILMNTMVKVLQQSGMFSHCDNICFTARREFLHQYYDSAGFTRDTLYSVYNYLF